MKLLIEINDYEKLKDIVETVMNDKRRKIKNILFCVTSLLFLASLILMINAICYKKLIFSIVFFILTLVFFCCFINILCDSGAYLKRIFSAIQEMQGAIIPYEERYIHKYDYYKIAGKLNEEGNDYVFYLYEPYKKNN